MKIFRKDFLILKNHIYILPSIEIVINDMMYRCKNCAVCFHWIIFHARILYLKEV